MVRLLSSVLAFALLFSLCACGPSAKEKAARKAAAQQAALAARVKAYEEASKPPVLTDKDVIQKGQEGLEYVDMKVGTGREAVKGGTVTVEFIGWMDGRKIDSSADRGKPFSFILGSNSVIKGWNLGIVGMKQGGVRLLIVPPNLAYGKEGLAGSVGPDKTLWYKITLVKAYEPY